MMEAGEWCDEIKRLCPRLYSHGIAHEFRAGWRPMIWRLSDKLEALIAFMDCPADELPYCVQVKEKYGTLRFYMSTSTQEMDALIESAQDESGMTCEICGMMGKTRYGGWVSTLCDDCFNTRQPTHGAAYVPK
jgi:hypothetical protein